MKKSILLLFLFTSISFGQNVSERRLNTESLYSSMFSNISDNMEDINIIVRIDNDDLVFDIETKTEATYKNEKVGPKTISVCKNFCYEIMKIALEQNGYRISLQKGNYENIKFKNVFLDQYYNRQIVELSISYQDLSNLKYPFTEYSFIKKLKLLNTYSD